MFYLSPCLSAFNQIKSRKAKEKKIVNNIIDIHGFSRTFTFDFRNSIIFTCDLLEIIKTIYKTDQYLLRNFFSYSMSVFAKTLDKIIWKKLLCKCGSIVLSSALLSQFYLTNQKLSLDRMETGQDVNNIVFSILLFNISKS